MMPPGFKQNVFSIFLISFIDLYCILLILVRIHLEPFDGMVRI